MRQLHALINACKRTIRIKCASFCQSISFVRKPLHSTPVPEVNAEFCCFQIKSKRLSSPPTQPIESTDKGNCMVESLLRRCCEEQGNPAQADTKQTSGKRGKGALKARACYRNALLVSELFRRLWGRSSYSLSLHLLLSSQRHLLDLH